MNSRMPCAVTHDLNNYLGRIERDEARAYAIERRAEMLLAQDGGYYPADEANFIEAMEELFADEKYAPRLALIIDLIGKAIAAPEGTADAQYQMIGLHLVGFLKDYWKRSAMNMAETEIDSSCGHCFGSGCRHCEEPENDQRN